MAITYGFFNDLNGDRLYTAEQMTSYFRGLVSDGVYANMDNGLRVQSSAGMRVQVLSGRALVKDHWLNNDSVFDVDINPAHVTLNRYTAIVMRYDGPNREVTITVKDGDPATKPTKPTMTRDSSVYELCLAYVYVGKGVTEITQSSITDCRADNTVCGWVTGLINQVDTTELFNQWDAAYQEYYEKAKSREAEFDTGLTAYLNSVKASMDMFLQDLEQELRVDTYIEKQEAYVVISSTASAIPLPEGLSYESGDVLQLYANGIRMTEGREYSLTQTAGAWRAELTTPLLPGNELTFVLLKSRIGASVIA